MIRLGLGRQVCPSCIAGRGNSCRTVEQNNECKAKYNVKVFNINEVVKPNFLY